MTIEEIELMLIGFRELCIRHGEYKEMRARPPGTHRPALLLQKFEGSFVDGIMPRQNKIMDAIKRYKGSEEPAEQA